MRVKQMWSAFIYSIMSHLILDKIILKSNLWVQCQLAWNPCSSGRRQASPTPRQGRHHKVWPWRYVGAMALGAQSLKNVLCQNYLAPICTTSAPSSLESNIGIWFCNSFIKIRWNISFAKGLICQKQNLGYFALTNSSLDYLYYYIKIGDG
jgi:hypothetical protein